MGDGRPRGSDVAKMALPLSPYLSDALMGVPTIPPATPSFEQTEQKARVVFRFRHQRRYLLSHKPKQRHEARSVYDFTDGADFRASESGMRGAFRLRYDRRHCLSRERNKSKGARHVPFTASPATSFFAQTEQRHGAQSAHYSTDDIVLRAWSKGTGRVGAFRLRRRQLADLVDDLGLREV